MAILILLLESFPLPACSRIFLEHRYSVADGSGVIPALQDRRPQLILVSRISGRTLSVALSTAPECAHDDDRRSFPRQRAGNRDPDAGRRNCDQSLLSIQSQIHSVVVFFLTSFRLRSGSEFSGADDR